MTALNHNTYTHTYLKIIAVKRTCQLSIVKPVFIVFILNVASLWIQRSTIILRARSYVVADAWSESGGQSAFLDRGRSVLGCGTGGAKAMESALVSSSSRHKKRERQTPAVVFSSSSHFVFLFVLSCFC
jgi:hypothetical protein